MRPQLWPAWAWQVPSGPVFGCPFVEIGSPDGGSGRRNCLSCSHPAGTVVRDGRPPGGQQPCGGVHDHIGVQGVGLVEVCGGHGRVVGHRVLEAALADAPVQGPRRSWTGSGSRAWAAGEGEVPSCAWPARLFPAAAPLFGRRQGFLSLLGGGWLLYGGRLGFGFRLLDPLEAALPGRRPGPPRLRRSPGGRVYPFEAGRSFPWGRDGPPPRG